MADTQSSNPVTESPAESFVAEAESTNLSTNQSPERIEEQASRALEISAQIAKELENKDRSADIHLKKLYGWGILFVLSGWIIFVIYFSIQQLNPCSCEVRPMSDAVIIALWTSATANILALPAIILKYLFPKRH
ncbi:MAG: hypothetical protein J6B13_02210 [Muribaculaceae bacterium]|nr:hypothetical protein [Muribaculaceae bacterium]